MARGMITMLMLRQSLVKAAYPSNHLSQNSSWIGEVLVKISWILESVEFSFLFLFFLESFCRKVIGFIFCRVICLSCSPGFQLSWFLEIVYSIAILLNALRTKPSIFIKPEVMTLEFWEFKFQFEKFLIFLEALLLWLLDSFEICFCCA